METLDSRHKTKACPHLEQCPNRPALHKAALTMQLQAHHVRLPYGLHLRTPLIPFPLDRPKSPGINNFSYVPSLPSPTPSELGPAAVKQLMTWGTLAGTPRILSQSDDPAEASAPEPSTPFHISAPTKREVLSHKLSSSAVKSLRAKATLLGAGQARRKSDMPPPSWTPRRAEASGALTPAARRLLDRTTMGTAASRRAEAMGRAAAWEKNKDKDLNRVRWTPTPGPVTQR
jgi:protein DGCR14